MSALNAENLLRVWEHSVSYRPIERALVLLDAAWPEVGLDTWTRASIGQRDACLLALREALFGTEMETVTHCPQCDGAIEASFHTRQIGVTKPSLPVAPEDFRYESRGYEVTFRLPTSRDVIELAGASPPAMTPETLLRRCIHDFRRDGAPADPAHIPSEVASEVIREMARRDPGAHIQIALSCPSCGHAWETTFDIVKYLWSELDDWAGRLLREIHLLAATYGWSERDLLAMSAVRRRTYLQLIQS